MLASLIITVNDQYSLVIKVITIMIKDYDCQSRLMLATND